MTITRHFLIALAAILFAGTTPSLAQATPQRVQLTLKGSWPEFPRGPARGVDVSGNYAYVAAGDAGLQVIDVSKPASPKQVAGVQTVLPAKDVRIVGKTAFVSTGPFSFKLYDSIAVFDISDPMRPVTLFIDALPETPRSTRIVGTGEGFVLLDPVVWPGTEGSGLEVFDLSNSAQPRVAATLDFGGLYEGRALSVVVAVKLAYITTVSEFGNGFHVIDFSHPEQPVRVGGIDGVVGKLDMVGNLICVAGPDFIVLDVSNPSQPVRVGMLASLDPDSTSGVMEVRVRDTLAYVVFRDGRIEIVDFSNPARPIRAGRFDQPGLSGVAGGQVFCLRGSYAYLLGGSGGMEILDLADSRQPKLVGVIGSETSAVASDVQVSGTHAFLADETGLRVLDVSDRSKPVPVATLRIAGGAWQLEVSEGYAYVVNLNYGSPLAVVDITDPKRSILRGSYSRPDSALWAPAVADDHAYVPWSRWLGGEWVTSGVDVLDLRDKANPARIATIALEGPAFHVKLVDQLAFLASDGNRAPALRILDVRDPLSPVQLVSFSPGHPISGIDVAGNRAYVAGTPSGGGSTWLSVIDITNPSNPIKLGSSLFHGDFLWDAIQVQGHLAFLRTSDWAGIRVLDVGNPAQPVLVAEYPSYGNGGFHVVGNTVYLANDDLRELRILELSEVLMLAPPVRSGNGLTLSWNGSSGIRLQEAGSLHIPGWQVVPGTEGKSTVTVPFADTAPPGTARRLYRVVKE